MPHHLNDMPLNAGDHVGAYEVIGQIGAGGMGIVYRARDTKLDRDVALKVLPEAFTSDPDRLARFEREAKVLASLNHPNIGSIYGLEEAEGGKFRALVLELVEGPTLADRIKQGPIPLDEALPIAKQIAEALEAAHEQGVMHRDLKPANVKVKEDGTVKVLDFGLAKVFQPDASDPNMSMSPTISLTAAATRIGMVIGTAAYMAPEQAKGLPVDKRADVWAFGAVLYEMLTGARPFVGDDVSEMLASVLLRDPEISGIGGQVPAHIKSLLRRCLVKDPKDRLRDIGEIRIALNAPETVPVTAVQAATTIQLRFWQRPIPAAIVALAVAVLASVAVWVAMRPEPPQVARFSLGSIPPSLDTGQTPAVAFSPDGTHVAFLGENRQLYVQTVGQLSAVPLREALLVINPFFSPDGNWVGYWDFDGGALRRQSVQGGPEITIAETAGIDGASWGPDDTIIFAMRVNNAGLFRVSAAGGEVEQITTLEEGEVAHRWPEFLPGGASVMFTIFRDESSEMEIALLDLGTSDRRTLIRGGSNPHYASTGHVVYGVDGTLLAVPFNLDGLEVTGDPVPVLEGVVTQASGAAQFSLASDGSLVYVPGTEGRVERTVVWVDRQGREQPLTSLPDDDYRSVDVSPDGTRLAVEVGDGTLASGIGGDVWIHDLARGTRNRLTTDVAEDQSPLWTPDGRHVVFGSSRGGSWGLFRRNADGTGEAERLLPDSDVQRLIANTWSPEGNTLVFMRSSNNRSDLALVSLGDETAARLPLESGARGMRAAISPDGNWIAYDSDRTGRSEVYVERFPDPGDRQLVSTNGGQQPLWSPDGRELFYLGPERLEPDRLMVVPVTTDPGFRAGAAEVVAEAPFVSLFGRQTYDVAPDGRLVLIKRGTETSGNDTPRQINVVLNWFEELKARVPVN